MCYRTGLKNIMRAAFTLTEMLIVISIIAIISVISIVGLQGAKNINDLNNTVKLAANLLRQAQSQSASGYEGVPWGVYFDNATNTTPFFAMYYSSYATATVASRYTLPVDIQYAPSSVAPGNVVNILFALVSAAPSTSTSITFNLLGGGGSGAATPASLSRQSSGKVFFDSFGRSSL